MIDTASLRDAFRRMHGREPRIFVAPGRVNLIGEHTDYNDGFVMPVAIDRATAVAAAVREDRIVRVTSLNAGETTEFDLDAEGDGNRGIWLDYVEGMARVLEGAGHRLRGADLVLASDLPEGAGLSSSAALEISTGLAMTAISGTEPGMVSLALAGQRAEHRYVGTMCGIMDQYVAALGETGHALLIDCRSLEYRAIPVDTSETALAICDTGVKHSLASSEYNVRRAECEHGVELLRSHLPSIRALRDVTIEEFERYAGSLPEMIARRCRHVITENARTLAAAEALSAGHLDRMGELMAASHRSLRDDYEVSCRELDIMVEIATGIDGVIGARMTGGGFGGSTVNLVRRDALDEFRGAIEERYRAVTSISPTILISEIGDGAREERGKRMED